MPGRKNSIAVLLGLAGSFLMLFCGFSAQAQEPCKAVLDATNKAIVTPSHIYSTTIAAYKKDIPENSELIYSGGPDGAIYIMIKGKWIRSKMSAADMLKQQEENRRTTKATCKFLRDDLVNGEAAAVYSAHEETESIKTDATIWISKSKGLPIKEDMDMDVGGAAGKSHRTMRYEYSNVKPPQI